MKVKILGRSYKVIFRTLEEESRFSERDGWCDPSVRKLYVRDYTREKPDPDMYEDMKERMKKTTRHEIVHAFFHESGLWHNSDSVDSWATDEELTDWIALQSPKLFKAFKKCNCL